jgi:hypothetical protein
MKELANALLESSGASVVGDHCTSLSRCMRAPIDTTSSTEQPLKVVSSRYAPMRMARSSVHSSNRAARKFE